TTICDSAASTSTSWRGARERSPAAGPGRAARAASATSDRNAPLPLMRYSIPSASGTYSMSQAVQVQGLSAGAVIAGTCEVTRLLGRVVMGSVWEARHVRMPGKGVAIKVLHADVASDPEALARFRREAEIATRLGHPNIVEVHDFNTLPGGEPYLVLELLEGEPLDE